MRRSVSNNEGSVQRRGAARKRDRHAREVDRCSATLALYRRQLDLPRDYAEVLGTIKARIQEQRLSAVMTANSAMVVLYWDIGRMILERQQHSERLIRGVNAKLSKLSSITCNDSCSSSASDSHSSDVKCHWRSVARTSKSTYSSIT